MPRTEAASTMAPPRHSYHSEPTEIESLVAAVDARICLFLQTESDRVRRQDPRLVEPIEAIRAMSSAGGKRIRPMFCFAGFLAAELTAPQDELVNAGVALELLHICALVHDDIMDASSERRGSPSAHVQFGTQHQKRRWHGSSEHFGTSAAILVGDLALIYSDRFMPRRGALDDIWFRLRADLVLGQYMDVRATAENIADVRLARWVAVAKSGEYSICYPLLLGATLGGKPELAPFFQGYGIAVGEAFQLRDDLIDVFGDSRIAGKTLGQDLRQGKMGLLLTLGAQRAPEIQDMIGHPDPEVGAAQARVALRESGAVDEVEGLISDLVARGCASVDGAPISARWKQWMHTMAHDVAYRRT